MVGMQVASARARTARIEYRHIPERGPFNLDPVMKNQSVPIPSADATCRGYRFSRPPGWGGRTTGGVHSAWIWCLVQETERQGAGVASLTRKKARRLVPRYRRYTVVSGQSCGPWPPDRGSSDVGGVPPRKGGLCQRSRSGGHPATCGRWAVPTVPAPAARRMVRPEIKGLTMPQEPSPAARAYIA